MLKRKPNRNPGFQLEQMNEEILLFNPETTRVVYLNETAALIWQLCDGQRNIAEIVSVLRGAYPEEADNIQKDVEQTLSEFEGQKVIHWV